MEENGLEEKLWTGSFLCSCFANLFAFMTMYYIMATLPLFVTEVLAGDKGQVGYLFGAFALAGVMARPLAGLWLDTFGRQKIAWLSIVGLFLALLAYRWAFSLEFLIILRIIHGIFWGFATTSLATLATDTIPLKKRGEGIGYFGLSISLAMFAGPLLGLAILKAAGYSMMFFLGAGLAGAALLFLFGIRGQRISLAPKGKARSVIEKKVLSYAGITFFLAVVYSGILSFIVLFAKDIGVENSGAYFLANALTVIISRPYAGRWLDRKGPAGIMNVGFLTLVATFVCLFFAESYVLFIASALLLGVGFGIIYSTAIALALNEVDAARRGVVNGTMLTAFDLGFGLGAILLGSIATYTGLRLMYLISGGLVVVPFLIFYLKYRMHKKRGEFVWPQANDS